MNKLDKANVQEIFELNGTQKGILFHHLEEADQNLYNVQLSFGLGHEVDVDILKAAFEMLQTNNESLRSVFNWDKTKKPLQIVLKKGQLHFDFKDLTIMEAGEARDMIVHLSEIERSSRFDLRQIPWRISLYKTENNSWVLNITHHHILYDGWSSSLLLQEVFKYYNILRNNGNSIPIKKTPLKEFKLGLEGLNQSKKTTEYWSSYLKGSEATTLSSCFVGERLHSKGSDKYVATIPDGQLGFFAQQSGVTVASIIYSAFGILMNKYSGNSDIVFGTTVSGRNAEIPGCTEILGNFINTIPLRINKIDSSIAADLVHLVNSDLLERKKYETSSYFDIKDKLGLAKDDVLFDIAVVIENYPISEELFAESNLAMTLNYDYENPDIPLLIKVFPESEVKLEFLYKQGDVSKEEVKRLASHFSTILHAITDESSHTLVSDIEMISEFDRNKILNEFNSTDFEYPTEQTLIDLFEDQVEKTPGNTAVKWGDQLFTYQQVDKTSNGIANFLQSHGIGSGDFIGVMMERGPHLISCLLGILKSGAAYVPIGVDYPDQRKQEVIVNSGMKLLVTLDDDYTAPLDSCKIVSLHDMLRNTKYETYVRKKVSQADLAYVIYTSGSTGQPKGVMIEHGAMLNRILWMQRAYPLSEEDTLIQKTPITFDVSVWELFWWSVTGASLYVMKPGEEKEPSRIEESITNRGVTFIHFVPTMFQAFLSALDKEDIDKIQHLKCVFTSGEALKPDHVNTFRRQFGNKGPKLINLYGPTEATVDVTFHECDLNEECLDVPIGRPIDNLKVYVIDKHGKLQPIGVPGELVIGGAGLARGYLSDAKQTAERFVNLASINENTVYKTGDLARFLPDGNVTFLGRMDDQVKIKGYRIELKEIEHYLNLLDPIQASVVACHQSEDGNQLVAYYLSDNQQDDQDLRQYLLEFLPEYKVPLYFQKVDELKISAHGKLDVKSLPVPRLNEATSFVHPTNEKERVLTQIWSDVLGIDRVGMTDDFIALGGDSIKSIQISSRVKSFGYHLSVQDILKDRTIEALSRKMTRTSQMTDQSMVSGDAVLTPIQQWFFYHSDTSRHHFNQSRVLVFEEGISLANVHLVFEKLLSHHDGLRTSFVTGQSSEIRARISPIVNFEIKEFDLRTSSQTEALILKYCDELQASLALEGPLIKLGLFHTSDATKLLIVIHHLLVDEVSWQILIEDIDTLCDQVRSDLPLKLSLKTDAYITWAEELTSHVKSDLFANHAKYWEKVKPVTSVPERDFEDGSGSMKNGNSAVLTLDHLHTEMLLRASSQAFNTQINDLLLTSLLLTFNKHYKVIEISLDIEKHGRHVFGPNKLDTNRTVGWFTSIHPVTLSKHGGDIRRTLIDAKEVLRSVPNDGVDFLLYRYGKPNENDASLSISPKVIFNYLGQNTATKLKTFKVSSENTGQEVSNQINRVYDWNFIGKVSGGQLSVELTYSEEQYRHETVTNFMLTYKQLLIELIEFCAEQEPHLTPSDVVHKGLSFDELTRLNRKFDLEDIYPLSPTQEGMLYHTILDNEGGNYFAQTTCKILGPLDVKAVEDSMNVILSRYANLRAVFLEEGFDRAIQVIPKDRKINCIYKDVREECQSRDIKEVVESFRLQDKLEPFDLRRDVLMRFMILQTGSEEFTLIWSHHHLLVDGWCMSVILRQLMQIYHEKTTGATPQIPVIKPYAEYIKWLLDRDNQLSEAFWREKLASYDTITSLPKKNRLALESGYKEAELEFILDHDLVQKIEQFSREQKVTINAIFQSAWTLLLAKFNGVEDVVYGSVMSGRPSELEGVEDMVGLFVNTVPFRTKLDFDHRVLQLLKQVQESIFECEPHSYYPLPEMQSLSELSHNLFDHILTFENAPDQSTLLDSFGDRSTLKIEDVKYTVKTNYDLNITILPFQQFVVRFDFNENCYGQEEIEKVGQYFKNLIAAIIDNPDLPIRQLSLMSEQEKSLIEKEFSEGINLNESLAAIQTLIAGGLDQYGENSVMEFQNLAYSYTKMSSDVNKIANYLLDSKLPVGSRVGVFCENRYNLICAILGTLRARMSFVPLDTQLPKPRLNSMMSQASINCVLSDQTTRTSGHLIKTQGSNFIEMDQVLSLGNAVFNYEPDYRASDEAYVYFTSGSTGEPKGVVGNNRGLAHFISWELNHFNLPPNVKFSQFTNPGFDVFLREILVPICSGGTICVPAEEDLSSGENIAQWIEQKSIEFIHCVPSFFKTIKYESSPEVAFQNLKYVLLAGEKIVPFELQKWYHRFGSKVDLYNIYGPTETTLAKGFYKIKPEDVGRQYIPIKALPGAQLLVLDSQNDVCPDNFIGEIFIRTPYMSNGYLHADKEKSDSFIPNPFSAEKHDFLYKTGDLGRKNGDSEIEILGRADHQVKIRGMRVELDDIKVNILSEPGVTDAFVTFNQQPNAQDNFISAYLITEATLDIDVMRTALRAVLPAYMVPSFFIRLEAFPLLPNGKIDRKALPKPNVQEEADYTPPSNEVEELLVEIWAEVLELDKSVVGTTKSFFAFGGHSLKVLGMISKINRRFNTHVLLKDIINTKNIRDLADYLITSKLVNLELQKSDEVVEVVL